ncbi:uncharacterized protein (DUF2235 family) [Methylosinus sp. sav-2]|uniref:DUF2235 domain-containing protein n=1 Tax=Methylosinus sp. sav-2 TaxID=2485168 RepID=UPI000A07BD54|nr:DUF2235 domain-containing protein [Methylosinus sp. sav-2]TDX65176.1 uncharacterized protein (DUF2235 family) [Methylosinus sp. sav-2]
MPKKLVIFCDGTWNEPTAHNTNVVRLLQATELKCKNGDPQILHYIAGVGNRKIEKYRGGILGYGVSYNIKDAYSFIVSNYEHGDKIYLFGFSRGAFIARVIADMIHKFGVLRCQDLHLVEEIYRYHKSRSEEWRPQEARTRKFREDNFCYYPVGIRFLGIWDTVGALGIPYSATLGRLNDRFFKTGFHDSMLNVSVDAAYHAIAADERRWPFRPMPIELSDYHRQRNQRNIAEHGFPLYVERWFPGVHSNVGGGYREHGLSDYTLQWMAERAKENGLNLKDLGEALSGSNRPFAPDLKEKIANSQTLLYRIPTVLLVKIPSYFGITSAHPATDQPLTKNIKWNGDYVRPIGTQEEVSDLPDKMGVDPEYRPPQLR